MVLSEDTEDHLFQKHKDLCNKLNLDGDITAEAWQTFHSIQTNYTLEGEPLHWLGCAVFVACKKTTTPTVGRSYVESSCVSLTSLLRHCNLSLTQFFNKITKWADMANMSNEFRSSIKRLEGSFAVSYNIFKKFTPIFHEIFKGPIEIETCKQPRNRKQRAPPCSPTKLFEFCWALFVSVKGKNVQYSEDLVTSFHLLVSCCDMLFKNAFLDDRKDLLNPNFSELPANWSDATFEPRTEAPCIVNYLCEKHNGTSTEAKYVKEYSWKELVDDLFLKGILNGNRENFTDLLDPANFENNLKNINKAYEVHLLSRGDFDERIFLAEYRRRLLLKEQVNTNGAAPFSPALISGDLLVNTSPRGESSGMGRRLSGSRSIILLQSLLSGRQAAPSETLIQIFQSCSNDPTEKIKQTIEKAAEKFCLEFAKQNTNASVITPEQAQHTATTLFYKFVENLFQNETASRSDLSRLAENEVFYQCTLACSFEIVIYSYNCHKKCSFPWILNVLNLPPFYFVRVIELIVRSTDKLSREAVKHLNMVEQKIFESILWKSDSLLWQVLNKEDFPKFEDTALPGNLVYNEQQVGSGGPSRKPIVDSSVSPSPSAIERFQSPIVGSLVEPKQLFKFQQSDNGNQVISTESRAHLPPPAARSKKGGSLHIILRKFYNLAYSRMEQLCSQLDIRDMKFTQKIWTIFEHSIREHTDLMRDRHLDQLLMCAVYVVCKVTGTRERKFAEIMEHYRNQPQANSHIYRNVLISRAGESGSSETDGERRGDLISFYNTVYVQAMKSFALQFSSSSNPNSKITLSPLPLLVNNNFVSPRCHISNNLYITPYDTPTNNFKGKTLEYHFSRSPSRDLEKINNAINKSIVGKRLLGDDNNTDAPNKRLVTKMMSMMEQRRNHTTE